MLQRILSAFVLAAAATVVADISQATAQPTASPPAAPDTAAPSAPSTSAPPPAAPDQPTGPQAAAPATPSVETAPAPPDSAAPPAAAQSVAPAPPSGPLVAYVKHTKPPFLIDQTIAAAELGMIGAIAAISAGHDIVAKNNIEDPSVDVAHKIAVAYAAMQGGQVAEAPISDDKMPPKTKPEEVGKYAGQARYVVAVAPVNMEIIYFVTDPLRRDLMLSSSGVIIDTSNGKVIAKGRCFIKSEKVGQRYNHDTLLADQAAGLKSLIVQKSEQCTDKMEEQMKIGPASGKPAT